jgi:hypothetical protein
MEQYFDNYKISKHHSEGIRGNSRQNFIFVKLKLVGQLSRTINFTNSEAELVGGEISEAEQSQTDPYCIESIYAPV